MSERKSSIHINPVKSTSEQHNNREQELDYVFPEHTHENERWIGESIADREKTIKRLCKQVSGRKMQKNAEPIREGVVNLQSHHTMEDLQKLKADLEKKWGFEIIQMHLHKDEGVAIKDDKNQPIEPKKLDPNRVNYHAHLVFDWQDKKTGKMLRYARGQMADLQTDVAKSLGMQRGKERTADKRTANERLEPIEYKVKQRGKELVSLQSEISELEQKKNKAWWGYCGVLWKTPGSEMFIEYLARGEEETMESLDIASVEELEEAIAFQSKRVQETSEEISELEGFVDESDEINRRIKTDIEDARGQIESLEQENNRIEGEIKSTLERIKSEEANILRFKIAIGKSEQTG